MLAISNGFFLLFMAFCMLGTLKIYIGSNLNWLISLLLLGTALACMLPTRPVARHLAGLRALLNAYKPMLLGWMLFMTGIAVSAALHQGTGLYTIAKYLVLLLVLLMLLLLNISSAQLERALTLALVAAVIPLLFFALFRVTDPMIIFGDGRMGWLAIWPGVLWKAGAYVWPFALWRHIKRPGYRTAALAGLSMLAMALDGSRTSLLWLSLTWVALAACGAMFKVQGRGLRTHAGLLALIVFIFALAQPAMLNWVEGRYDPLVASAVEKISNAFHSGPGSLTASAGRAGRTALPQLAPPIDAGTSSERLINGNTTTRKAMLQEGWRQAVARFPWGCGFGCTTVDDNGVRTVIHMTYLQILGDEGILALAGYMLIMLFPLYKAFSYLGERRECLRERFELMLTPVSVLLLYLLIGFLHPLSNELTEWALVLGAIATVMMYVKRSD